MEQVLIKSGNECAALAVLHSGVSVAYSYPGTPSTEIMADLIKNMTNVKWNANEKTALEAALGDETLLRVDAGRSVVITVDFLGAFAGHCSCHGEVDALLGDGGDGVGVVDVHLRAADVLALVDAPSAAYAQLFFGELDDDTAQLAHFKVE